MHKVFVCVVTLVVLSTGAPVAAHPSQRDYDEIERRITELRRLSEELEAREGELRGDISATAERRETLTEELAELQALVTEAQGRLDAQAGVLAGIQADLDRTTDELERKERALERTLDRLHTRAIQVYKRGPVSLFEMLFGADGLRDLAQRLQYVVQLVRVDNERVDAISKLKADIQRERDEIAHLRDQQAAQVAVVRSERNQVASVEQAVAARHGEVSAELRSQYTELGDIEAQKEEYRRETAQLQAESQRIAALLRGQSEGPANVGRGGMAWPADGPVTSGYGWRQHPILGERRFHAGIDIGAPHGAPVWAASAGSVVSTDAGTGYGRAIVIDHGGSIATVYAHLSRVGVSVGRTVARGERIGDVGCTGYCTGPHLHFEVRIDGDPDNPMNWLPPR